MITFKNAIALAAILALTGISFQTPAQADAAASTGKAAAEKPAKEKKSARRAIAQKLPAESTDSPKKGDSYVPYSDSSQFIMGD